MQPNISLNLQPIKFALNSNSQGFSQNWCQGEPFPLNACVTDFVDLEQMCHTAVTGCEISSKCVIRHIQELLNLHQPTTLVRLLSFITGSQCPCMALHTFAEQSQHNYELFIVPFLFRTNFLLVIVNFIRTAYDVLN